MPGGLGPSGMSHQPDWLGTRPPPPRKWSARYSSKLFTTHLYPHLVECMAPIRRRLAAWIRLTALLVRSLASAHGAAGPGEVPGSPSSTYNHR